MAKRETDKPPLATPATPATWGLPDWKDASSYSAARNGFQELANRFPDEPWWLMDRWRWEFLRRRDDYRSDFAAAYKEYVAFGFGDPETQGGYFCHEGAEKYGLEFFYNPAISDWGVDAPSWYDPESMLSDPPDASERWWQIKTLTFDLGKPLALQLEAAKALLEDEQGIAQLTPEEQMTFVYGSEYGGGREIPMDEISNMLNRKPRAIKPVPERWALYLRVLDAREAGASLSQISAILPPHIARRDPKAAHNVYEQARALQFRF